MSVPTGKLWSEWLITSMLAEYRGESVRSARRFMASGKVAVYRDGGRPRVRRSDVDAYMELCRTEQAVDLKALVTRAVDQARRRRTA